MTRLLILVLFLTGTTFSFGQNQLDNYLGGWAGELASLSEFKFEFHLQKIPGDNAVVTIVSSGRPEAIILDFDKFGYFSKTLKNGTRLSFCLKDEDPIGFIQTGHHLSNLDFQLVKENHWQANWNLFLAENFDPTFYLSLNKFDNGSYAASTFFQSPVCHYMYGIDFESANDKFTFRDLRSGMLYSGTLKSPDSLYLRMEFLGESTAFHLTRLDYNDWKRGEVDTEVTASISTAHGNKLDQILPDVLSNELEGTHSILISQKGELIYEEYFDGFNPDAPHDTRSVAKSFAGALIGIAIDKGLLESEQLAIKSFFEKQHPYIDWSNQKDEVSIFHLLTMSSGIDAIDFGLNRESFANEGNFQSTEDWSNHILSAPMVYEPGSQANYGSGSPALLAPILESIVDEPIEFFAHRNLFGPMGITNYRFQVSNQNQPYFGGGWYFTPGDLLKFGELYLNNGKLGDQQVISEEWAKKSLAKHTLLANTFDQNEYGFLFWHKTYDVNGVLVKSIEARGSGGQYLFIVPSEELVVMITSGNYSNNKGFQPERIMADYILKALVKK